MKLEISYSELAFLKELVQREKLDIWHAKHIEGYKELAIEKMFKNSEAITIEEHINVLLKKFDKTEVDERKKTYLDLVPNVKLVG